MRAFIYSAVLAAIASFSTIFSCEGQVVILHSFGGPSDATAPKAGLIQGLDGNFYGTCSGNTAGGFESFGTVYRLTSGGSYSVVHSFTGPPSDGHDPEGEVTQGSDGFLYGTTFGGGSSDQGALFKMSTTGTTTTILHSFPDSLVGNDGIEPKGNLVIGVNGYYGASSFGGQFGAGIIYNFGASSGYSVIHAFAGIDGSSPQGMVADAQGNLYGTASGGGGTNGAGTVFEVSFANGTTSFSVLHTFDDITTNPRDPTGPLCLAKDGNFYGTSVAGGINGFGTVFEMLPGGAVTVLHSFSTASTDGYTPQAGLIQAKDGNFYGTTQLGGAGSNPTGGTVYSISSTGTFTLIHSFKDGTVANDGVNPEARLIQGSDGNLYGTTAAGGANGKGTIFEVLMGYPAWVAKYSLTGASALPTAVLQPDGLANILKYSLGLDPTVNYNPGSAGLPVVQIQNVSGTNYLTLMFTGVAFDVTYNVQASSDLATWTTIYTHSGTTGGPVTVQDTQDVTVSPKRFMRLMVTYP